jgi:hypothetical protein
VYLIQKCRPAAEACGEALPVDGNVSGIVCHMQAQIQTGIGPL